MDMKALRTTGIASGLATAAVLLASLHAVPADAVGSESSWGEPVLVDPSQDGHGRPTDVSCASHHLCVLVDAAGYFSIRHGDWSEPETLDPHDAIHGIVDTS